MESSSLSRATTGAVESVRTGVEVHNWKPEQGGDVAVPGGEGLCQAARLLRPSQHGGALQYFEALKQYYFCSSDACGSSGGLHRRLPRGVRGARLRGSEWRRHGPLQGDAARLGGAAWGAHHHLLAHSKVQVPKKFWIRFDHVSP